MYLEPLPFRLHTRGRRYTLLRQSTYRKPFFEFGDSISTLRKSLRQDATKNIQFQYTTMLCLWVLTFDSVRSAAAKPAINRAFMTG